MRTQILLSTYNGAVYLHEQLESLAAQQYEGPCEIIIRDDGSTDETTSIARTFADQHTQVHVIEGENIGVVASFGKLLQAADESADLFMFCDQDDVWLPDKVRHAYEGLSRYREAPYPALYACRSVVTDANLVPISETNRHPKGPSLRHSLVQTIAPGHTMAFNRSLLRLARDNYPVESIIMHDSWLYTIAAGLGAVVFDRTTHCLYRTHETNTLGYDTGGLARFAARIRRVLQLDRSCYTRQATAFANLFADCLDVDSRAALTGFAYGQSTLTDRLRYLSRFPLVHETPTTSLVANLLYALGRYRLR